MACVKDSALTKNIMNIRKLIAISAVVLLLAGCSSSKQDVPDNPPAEIYATAQQHLHSGSWKSAITQLETLDSRYPFGPYAQQVQLDLIYAYYKNGDYPLAQATIDRFIRLNPAHSNIDYVLYMSGLTAMALDDNFLQNLLRIDRSNRDPANARQAFHQFSRLLLQFPHSQYAADANKRLLALKERLAKYELAVVEYYTKRGAWVAVVNRTKGMLIDYPDTQATRKALPYMQKAYQQLQLNSEADKVAKLISANL